MVMLGACPSPCPDYLVSCHLLSVLAGVTSTHMKQQGWDLTALENIISSQFWLVCGGAVLSLSGDTLFYLLSVNKVKRTVFKDRP